MTRGVTSDLRHMPVKKRITQKTGYLSTVIRLVKSTLQPNGLPREKLCHQTDHRGHGNLLRVFTTKTNPKIKILFTVRGALFPGKNAGFTFHFVRSTESTLQSKISRAKHNECDVTTLRHCVGCARSGKSTSTSRIASVVSVGTKQFHNY